MGAQATEALKMVSESVSLSPFKMVDAQFAATVATAVAMAVLDGGHISPREVVATASADVRCRTFSENIFRISGIEAVTGTSMPLLSRAHNISSFVGIAMADRGVTSHTHTHAHTFRYTFYREGANSKTGVVDRTYPTSEM